MDPGLPAGRPLAAELAEEPAYVVWRAAARVNVVAERVLPEGVDLHAYAVLLALARGATRTQQELADTIRVSRTTMVKVAASLAQQGLVTRARKPGDRRSWALTRTPAGANAARRWRRHIQGLERALTASLSAGEPEELRDLLERVVGPELPDGTPAPLRASTGFLVTRLHFRTNRELAAALAPLEVESRHVGVLTALSLGGPTAQVELARRIGVSGSRLVQIADDLERRGLVERRRGTADRRTHLLQLLPGAVPVVERARAVAAETASTVLAPLGPGETRRLLRLLTRLADAA